MKEAESSREGSTRARNIMERIYSLTETGRGTDIPGVRGSLFGALNVVSEYIDHEKRYSTPDIATENSWFAGAGVSVKARAFDLALQLLK